MEINTLDDFIKSMPKDLNSTIEKVRYLYIELGKRSFYDTEYKYFMFDEEESYGNYTNRTYCNPNIIICTTLSKQFLNLLTNAGIKAELEQDKYGHYYVSFYDENNINHATDITNDLKNIQFGCRTEYFATNTVPEEKVKNIDKKIGYISDKRSYSEDYWHIVKDSISDDRLTEKQKLEIVLNSIQNFVDITKPRGYRDI